MPDDDLDWLLAEDPIAASAEQRRGYYLGPPHKLIVEAMWPETGEIDYEIEHPDCKQVERYQDEHGNGILEYDCGVWWEISEGGGLLEALEGTDEDSNLIPIPPGTYWIQHWSQRYDATPDHATEWDAGMRYCTQSGKRP